jgi:hypothetical protein
MHKILISFLVTIYIFICNDIVYRISYIVYRIHIMMDDDIKISETRLTSISSFQMPSSSCFYSSFVFITNTLICYYFNYVLYSALFFTLFATSVIYHSNKSTTVFWIDRVAVISVIVYGAYIFFGKYVNIDTFIKCCIAICIVLTFLITIFIYYYGYKSQKFCFYENREIGDLWHSLIHFISCIGHILIVLL